MKKNITLVVLLVTILVFPSTSFAHTLETNGTVGAVLHIDPDDDPIVGQNAAFFFEFKDKENKFNPSQCVCRVKVIQGGTTVYEQDLFANNSAPSLINASFQYTFPQRDVYQIVIDGTPSIPQAFSPFTLKYDLRVDRQASAATSTTSAPSNQPLPWILGLILVGILGGGLFYWRKRLTNA